MKKTHASSLLIRVGLTAVILAAVAVTALNFSLLKHKLIDLQARLTAQTAARVAAEDALSKTKNNLVATAAALQSTRAALDAATAEKEQALAAAVSHKKQAEKLAGELVATAKDRDDARPISRVIRPPALNRSKCCKRPV
jgi:chromosome segregation ATPase